MDKDVIENLKQIACNAFSKPRLRDYYDTETVSRVTRDGGWVTSSRVRLSKPVNIVRSDDGNITLSFDSIKDLSVTITPEEQKEYMSYICRLIEEKKEEIASIITQTHQKNKDMPDQRNLDGKLCANIFNLLTGGNEYVDGISSSENVLADGVDMANDTIAATYSLDWMNNDQYATTIRTPEAISAQKAQRDNMIKKALKNLYLSAALNTFYRKIYNINMPKYITNCQEVVNEVAGIQPKDPLAEVRALQEEGKKEEKSVQENKEQYMQDREAFFDEKAKPLEVAFAIVNSGKDSVRIKYTTPQGKAYDLSFKFVTEYGGNNETYTLETYSLVTKVKEVGSLKSKQIFSDEQQVGDDIWRSNGASFSSGAQSIGEALTERHLFERVEDEDLKVLLKRAQKDALKAIQGHYKRHNRNNKLANVRGKLSKKINDFTEKTGIQKAAERVGLDIKVKDRGLNPELEYIEKKISDKLFGKAGKEAE